MRRTVRLSERELSRLVKRVIKEGLVLPPVEFTSPEGKKVTVNCTKGVNGAGTVTGGSENKSIPLEGEMYFMFC